MALMEQRQSSSWLPPLGKGFVLGQDAEVDTTDTTRTAGYWTGTMVEGNVL